MGCKYVAILMQYNARIRASGEKYIFLQKKKKKTFRFDELIKKMHDLI